MAMIAPDILSDAEPTHLTANSQDYHWLVGDEAAKWLDEAARSQASLVALSSRLRKQLSAERTHLVLEQIELRRRAAAKFKHAGRMFFTPVGLEQATDEVVATYKARRFAALECVADLCCGIGGDLLALAGRGPTVAVDRDAVSTIFASANLQAAAQLATAGATECQEHRCLTKEVAVQDVADCGAWHIDPDRRPQGRRTTQLAFVEPGLDVLDGLRQVQPSGAVKLAPASSLPQSWEAETEAEWISRGGECRQLVAWLGALAFQPGWRRATVLDRAGQATSFGCASTAMNAPVEAATKLGRLLYEPDAALIAAGLVDAIASEHALQPIASGAVYLTGNRSLHSPLLAEFEIDDVLPLDMKKIKALLRERNIGQLEVKKRGVDLDPAVVRKQLRPAGSECATLILTRIKDDAIGILARRLE